MAHDLTSLMWLLLVLAAIPLALWLLKRTPLGGAASAPGTARTVGVLPLSPSQRVVTVEVGSGDERLWLVLGVTPQGITNLHTMAPQDHTAPMPSPAAVAEPLLQRLRRGLGDGGPDGR